ncbi:MAG: GNAT family N-acetyltransferase [Rhodospirillales bacterium]|jgi:GNAT superfamily N-acetyltransferase|nr:GNAT family N-acetyltransferase [Rhodospirillales bacterium]MDP6803779.1 GNAT family N-acetyltransferase [Rhodospirillales bacterium]
MPARRTGRSRAASKPRKATRARKIECVITYMEMNEPPSAPLPPVPLVSRLALMRAERPGIPFYRFLYNTVGDAWLWYERRLMDDEALGAVIHDDGVEIYVLYVGGVPAGYGEIDRRREPEIEIAYLGLMPDFIGRGLGRYLMRWTVDQAWTYGPERVWAHTCTLDHPRALSMYQRTGFVPVRQERLRIDDPRLSGTFG